MINKQVVIIGFDGSKHSDRAVDFVLDNFDRNSTIYLVYTEQAITPIYLSNPTLFVDDSIIKKIRNEAKNKLNERINYMKKRGSKAEYVYCEGYPPAQIIKEAKRRNADIIVVGSRGMGKWKGAMLGSVSRTLATISRIPVLIVK